MEIIELILLIETERKKRDLNIGEIFYLNCLDKNLECGTLEEIKKNLRKDDKPLLKKGLSNIICANTIYTFRPERILIVDCVKVLRTCKNKVG